MVAINFYFCEQITTAIILLMKRAVSFLFTLYLWSFLLISILPFFIVFSLVWLLTLPFDSKRVMPHYVTCVWAKIYFLMSPGWKLKAEGRDKIKKGSKYVMVSNHESLTDILLLMQLFVPFRWITKVEISRVPVLGWVITMNKYIPVKRGDKESKAIMLEACRRSLNDNIPVFFFPEGTRTTNGFPGAFKDGAFITALENEVPVLPIVIDGPYKALPKKGFFIEPGQLFRIKILDEISISELRGKSPEEVAEYVRAIIVNEKLKF